MAARINWDEQDLTRGTMELARELGVNSSTVSSAKRKRGIPPALNWDRRPKGINWDEQDLARGTMKLARELGVSSSVVSAAKRKRGIPPALNWERHKGINWDEQDFTRRTSELARELGVSSSVVSNAKRRRGIPSGKGINWDEQPLGESQDRVLAQRLGVSEATIGRARRARGVPSFSLPCSVCGRKLIRTRRGVPICNVCSCDFKTEVGRTFGRKFSWKNLSDKERQIIGQSAKFSRLFKTATDTVAKMEEDNE